MAFGLKFTVLVVGGVEIENSNLCVGGGGEFEISKPQ